MGMRPCHPAQAEIGSEPELLEPAFRFLELGLVGTWICSLMKVVAVDESLREAPRLDSTKIDTKA